MDRNKILSINIVVVVISSLLTLFGFIGIIEGTSKQNGLDSVIISEIFCASLFIVGTLGLLFELLILNLTSRRK